MLGQQLGVQRSNFIRCCVVRLLPTALLATLQQQVQAESAVGEAEVTAGRLPAGNVVLPGFQPTQMQAWSG